MLEWRWNNCGTSERANVNLFLNKVEFRQQIAFSYVSLLTFPTTRNGLVITEPSQTNIFSKIRNKILLGVEWKVVRRLSK